MNLHHCKREGVVAEVTTAPGRTSLLGATEWANAVGLTIDATTTGQRVQSLDLTWIEWDALAAAVSALRAGGGE